MASDTGPPPPTPGLGQGRCWPLRQSELPRRTSVLLPGAVVQPVELPVLSLIPQPWGQLGGLAFRVRCIRCSPPAADEQDQRAPRLETFLKNWLKIHWEGFSGKLSWVSL